MTGTPVITTERLELWRPTAPDLHAMFAIVSHPQTGRFLGPSDDMANHFVRFCRNAGSWTLYGYGGMMVRYRGADAVIGNCGIFHSWRGLGADFDDHPEAGWILAHDQVGKGLGEEAMRAVLEWFDREHGPRRVVCMTAPENAASLHLAGKLGFAPLREATLPGGEAVALLARPAGAAGRV